MSILCTIVQMHKLLTGFFTWYKIDMQKNIYIKEAYKVCGEYNIIPQICCIDTFVSFIYTQGQ